MTLQSKLSFVGSRPLESGQDGGGEPVFDLPDLLRIVRTRKRVILGAAAAVVTLTAIALFQVTPRYTATALVMLDQRENRLADVEAVLSGLPTDPASIENQVQILRSRTLLSRVADKLALKDDPEFNPLLLPQNAGLMERLDPRNWFSANASTAAEAAPPNNPKNLIIDRMLGRLSAAAQGRSTAIQIRFQSPSPDKAAMIANSVADAYVEDQLNAKFEATQAASKWLAERLEELSGEVQSAERAVQQYMTENNLTETSDGTSLVEQQLGDLNAQLVIAKTNVAEHEAKYARVTELQERGRAADVSQVVESPLITQLRGQEADLMRQEAELASRYGALHPRMADIGSQRRNLESKIALEVQRVVETVANEVAIARARLRSLQSSLGQVSAETTSQNQAKVRLRELEAAATSKRSLYEAFLTRFNETQGQQDIQTPDARVISRAEVPNAASFPKTNLTLGAAVPGGLFLGFLIAMLMEKLDTGFRTTAQVERATGLPVLATLPEMSGLRKGRNAAGRVIDKPLSAFAEAIRGLQLGLTLSNVDRQPKVVLVTSSVASEGKTTVAINLARLAAKNGQKVILVDGDLRRPSVAHSMGIKGRTRGIAEAIAGSAPLNECLVRDPRSGMVVLPAVGNIPNPSELLGSMAMQSLVEKLRGYFDLVVIDSAPVLPVNDTKVVSKLVDAVLFVVRWEKTPREAVSNGVRALSDVKAPVAGIALTRADTKRHRYYNYGYNDYSSTKYFTE